MSISRPVDWPPPNNNEVFEDICTWLYEKVWEGIQDFKQLGRKGQKQYGVDIYGDLKGKYYAIQCKQKGQGKKVTEKEINDEIEKALNFKVKISHYLFATTAPRDAKIQMYISNKNEEHRKKGLFIISIDFWDDASSTL